MPEFMIPKFKRSMMSKNKTSEVQSKNNQEPKAKFKLFGVPKQTSSKRTKSIKGAEVSSNISGIMKTESTSSNTVTTTIINLRGVKPKQFAQKILISAQNALKVLGDMLGGMEEDISFNVEEVHISKPGCSKAIEPKRRYPKRNVAKKCYKEEDISSEDEFLYCDICKEEHKGPCPVHGPMLLVCDTKTPKGDPERAKRTLPYFFSLGISSLPKAGLGVWSEIPLIAGMVFGPYEGSIVKKNEDAKKSGYAWQVRKQSKPHHYVEGVGKDSSNWMRYVNCADHEEWQNVIAFQYLGKIYYRTYKPVLPFTEILVWYGDGYASELGIELKERKCLQPPKEITGFSCNVCNGLFSSSESLMKHQRNHPHLQHDRRHRCPECSYSSDSAAYLRDHLRTHSREKPHACPHCPKRFSLETNLRKHALLHMGLKEHACNICGKRFSQKNNLLRHERVHSGERPYRCPDCGKDFSQSSHLKYHQRLHTRQKPYPCPQCERRFSASSILTKHIVYIHTRRFPHQCSLCGKGFISPGELKKHTQRQHRKLESVVFSAEGEMS
ncbi:histone-lysine N-methyltransferase PRDM9-like [Argiope bruennichi]|uniref:histone-lysine N-methyltransferase PRDM9-like n=1 Tax=Argiope bruennichi TaxID=94029 RepID=UPI00249502F6|nr:histone-lysine N-methyltransferase PRDM9-like [Argiope bruennichi]